MAEQSIFSIYIAGPLFTKKTPSYGYRDPHYKPKTVWRPSQLYNGNPYTDKTASSQWIKAQFTTTTESMITCCQMKLRNKLQSNINQRIYIHEIASGNNLCKMSLPLLRPDCNRLLNDYGGPHPCSISRHRSPTMATHLPARLYDNISFHSKR